MFRRLLVFVLLATTMCSCAPSPKEVSPFTLEQNDKAVKIEHRNTDTNWIAEWYDESGKSIAIGDAEKYDIEGNLIDHSTFK